MTIKKNTKTTVAASPKSDSEVDLVIVALEAALAVLRGGSVKVEAEVEAETPAPKAAPKSRAKAKAVEPEPEEEDEDEDEEDDSDREAELTKLGLRNLRNILKNEHGWAPGDYKGLDIDDLVSEIIEAESEGDEDDDEEEEDDDLEDDEDDEDEDEEDEDDEEDDEEDEEEDYDPDSMTDAEVRKLAKENGIKVTGLKGKALRAAVFE